MSVEASMQQNPAGWRWDCSYVGLPGLFYVRTRPVPVREPRLVVFNRPLAVRLGLDPDELQREENAGIFTGNIVPDGADPIAQGYAGHQFGHFTGLGDGRAILLGEQLAPDGVRFDIQLKGSGRTPFSRGGDGRAALGPMLREYLISEAMHALGIPTTRSLAVAMTGETVARQEVQPGAVLTRVAASHIRVGTFQWAAAHHDTPALRALADHTMHRHFPEVATSESPYSAMFEEIMSRQAALVAKWMLAGFIHGVMNTDNMALSGETIDYGPCAFMDAYDPGTVFSSIDHHGRYAYGNQWSIARWNLARLAEAMLPLLADDRKAAVDVANGLLGNFESMFRSEWHAGMKAKLGLFSEEAEDAGLMQSLLDWMESGKRDFTHTFRTLSRVEAVAAPPFDDSEFADWHAQWRARLLRQPETLEAAAERMRCHNPSVIPRNHLVEETISAAVDRGDFAVMEQFLEVLRQPWSDGHPESFTAPPVPGEEPYQTFCGT